MRVEFQGDELFTLGAALEVAMTVCEKNKDYRMADAFAELYKRVDDEVRSNGDL